MALAVDYTGWDDLMTPTDLHQWYTDRLELQPGFELQFAIDEAARAYPRTTPERVSWVFCCEWDCDVFDWHRPNFGQTAEAGEEA